MSSAPLLTARVRHRVGSLVLDAEITLRERWTVLFGPSGAGKSTLLRILAGLVQADQADVQLGRAGTIGFIMQQAALFPHLSVERNIAFGLHSLGGTNRRARLRSMLDLFELGPLADRLPGRLSGGEQQRVALARALAPAPTLLLLDEPFGALDAALKESLLSTLSAALARENIAALYVSHDVAEAFQLQAEVLLLEAGKLTAQGPAEVVLHAHRARLLRQLGG